MQQLYLNTEDGTLQKNMSKYCPMRLSKREIKDIDQLHFIVDTCDVVRIASSDDKGLFIVPVNYGYDWDVESAAKTTDNDNETTNASPNDTKINLTLWLHSAKDGRKARAFALNPQVAIEMDIPEGLITGKFACAYSLAYRSIMGTGIITKAQDKDTKIHGLTKIMEHLAPDVEANFSEDAINHCDIYRIDVKYFTGKQRQ